MRRVITVNLGGNACDLDEDAYERLRAYFATVQNRLGPNPERATILADLERSIATQIAERRVANNESLVSDASMVEVLKAIAPLDAGVTPANTAAPGAFEQPAAAPADPARAASSPAPQSWPEDSRFARLPVFVLCLFLGWFGVHRFYVGKIGTGLLQLVTIGGLGLWTLFDLLVILLGSFTDADARRIERWI